MINRKIIHFLFFYTLHRRFAAKNSITLKIDNIREAFDQYILTGDYHSKGNISSSNKTMTDKSLFGEEVGEH